MVGAFDYTHADESCESVGFANNNIHFYNNDQVSQLVITDSAASCALNQMAKSPIGHLQFNNEKWNQFWHVNEPGFFDTTSIKRHIKIFEEKVGPNVPLKVDASLADISVKFGQYNTDVAVDYTLCMKFSTDQPKVQAHRTSSSSHGNIGTHSNHTTSGHTTHTQTHHTATPHPTNPELLYDCLQFSTSADVSMDNDIVHANII